ALALADGGDQVDDPRGRRRVAVFEAEPLVRVDGGEIVEVRPVSRVVGGQPVDGGDTGEAAAAGVPVPLPVPGAVTAGPAVRAGAVAFVTGGAVVATLARRHGAFDQVALAQSVLTDLGGRERDVAGRPAVAGRPQVTAPVVDIDDAHYRGLLGGRPPGVPRNAALFLCSCFFCDCCHRGFLFDGESNSGSLKRAAGGAVSGGSVNCRNAHEAAAQLR